MTVRLKADPTETTATVVFPITVGSAFRRTVEMHDNTIQI